MTWFLLAWALLATGTALWLTWRWHHTRLALWTLVDALREEDRARRELEALPPPAAPQAPRKPGRRSFLGRAQAEADQLIRDCETGWL